MPGPTGSPRPVTPSAARASRLGVSASSSSVPCSASANPPSPSITTSTILEGSSRRTSAERSMGLHASFLSVAVFIGVGVALVTLFDEDGEVDAAATGEHAARLVEAGVRAVVVSGSTGEAAALSAEERMLLLEAVRSAVPDEIPVLAGTGAPSARQAAALTLSAREHGADAALVLSPPRVSDPRPYFEIVARAAGDMAVLAYHFPAVSPPGIPVEALPDLPVAGLK